MPVEQDGQNRIMAARARTMLGCLIAYPSRESLSAWDGMNRAF
jgi:hypothetical protein